jgi:hypothetical protein
VTAADTDVSPAPVADVGDTVAAVPPPASTSACVAEYLIVRADVAAPLAFTVPGSVAVVDATEVAAPVVTLGAAASVVNDPAVPLELRV